MKNDMDAFMMYLRAISGEKNIVEHMEKEGQQQAANLKLMARKMIPSKEAFEKLGFEFIDLPGDDVLCKAILPEGWNIEPTDHSMWSNILDKNKNVRGTMFYKAASYDRNAHMSLQCRYGIHIAYLENHIIEIYFGNENEKLFIAGQIYNPDYEDNDEYFHEEDRLKKLAEDFAKENYPDWKNINAYWEDDMKLTYKPKENNQ